MSRKTYASAKNSTIIQNAIFNTFLLGLGLLFFAGLISSLREDYYVEKIYQEEVRLYNEELDHYNETNEKYQKELREYKSFLIKNCSVPHSGNVLASVTIKSERTNNQSIGGEIDYEYAINDETVDNNSQVYINLFKENSFSAEIRERDPSSDDVGVSTTDVFFSASTFNHGESVHLDVSVHEHYGKSAGNTAKFRVTFFIQPITPVISSTGHIISPPTMPKMSRPITPDRESISLSLSQVFFSDWLSISIISLLSLLGLGRIFSEARDAKLKEKNVQTSSIYEKSAITAITSRPKASSHIHPGTRKDVVPKQDRRQQSFAEPNQANKITLSTGALRMLSTPNSSCFSAVGYDLSQHLLVVKFRTTGCVNLFHDFPAIKWNEFITSSSMGKWYHANINGKFRCTTSYASPLPPAEQSLPAPPLPSTTTPKPHKINTTNAPQQPAKPTVVSLLKAAGIKYIDNRSKGGALWAIGGPELSAFMKECHQKCGVRFTYKAGGGKATNGKSAWWTK